MSTDNKLTSPAETKIKYNKPKILLIDLEETTVNALQNSGWNVSRGTFGAPYRVSKSNVYARVNGKAILPNHTEQEIVIIDLRARDLAPHPDGAEWVSGEKYVFTSAKLGFIDPRPKNMAAVEKDFQRILNNGGVFVIFADAVTNQKYVKAKANTRGDSFEPQELDIDIYGFLPELKHLHVLEDKGSEMLADLYDPILGPLVGGHLAEGTFGCTFKLVDEWPKTLALAKNKFGEPVGLVNYNEKTGSVVIVLPRLTDTSGFLLKLLGEALPRICPVCSPTLSAESGSTILITNCRG